MSAETGEKLATKLDQLRAIADDCQQGGDVYAAALVDYLDECHEAIAGRLDHVDENTHRLLQQVGMLLDELERFRPLLNMISSGTRAPDFISVGQGIRTARKAARVNARRQQ